MKESEIDIMARNLLQNAEETVSPKVWEGVSAALDARKRVVPFWAWALSGVAAAAAVVLGVFLYRPSVSAIPAAPLAGYVQAASQPEGIVPLQQQMARSAVPSALAMTQEEPAPQAAPLSTQAIPAQPFAAAVIPASQRLSVPVRSTGISAEDQALLNRLAQETVQQPAGENGLSLLVSGNFQGNGRGNVSSAAYHRAFRPLSPRATQEEGIYNEYPEVSFSLPVSGGLGFLFNFHPRWAVGTGIRYTHLSRTFVAEYVDSDGFPQGETDIDNHQHWVGVPLNLYFHIVNKGRWRIHSFVGGAGEYLVDNDFLIHSSPRDIHYHQGGFPLQWSAAVGLGMEFKLTPGIGLYLDPSFRYYFGTENQPRSIRTIQPLRVDLEAGVRFSL